MDLIKSLHEIDGGRYIPILNVIDVKEYCAECNYFNLSIKDVKQSYRCACIPHCIGTTLRIGIISYLNYKLGWISGDEHMEIVLCN